MLKINTDKFYIELNKIYCITSRPKGVMAVREIQQYLFFGKKFY